MVMRRALAAAAIHKN
jgi:NaMN:DMB phosphoribosyltransferase